MSNTYRKKIEFNIPFEKQIHLETQLKPLKERLIDISSIKVFVKKTYRINPDETRFNEFFHDIPIEQLLNETLIGYNDGLKERHAKRLKKYHDENKPYGIMKIEYIITDNNTAMSTIHEGNEENQPMGGSRKSIKPSRKPSKKTSRKTSKNTSRKPSKNTSKKTSKKKTSKKKTSKKSSKKKRSKKN